MDRPKDSSLSCSYDIFKGPVKRSGQQFNSNKQKTRTKATLTSFYVGWLKNVKICILQGNIQAWYI
jgi:hypothetical protein